MSHPKRTPLYETHLKLGARMVPFGEWEMPVSYSGISSEHHAVRTAAGLFDVSHMGEIVVSGSDALALVQHVTTNDASKLSDGQAQYSTLTSESGGIVDDLLVYRFDVNRYMLVVNASNIANDMEWIRNHNPGTAMVRDQSDDTGLIAVQGPRSRDLLAGLSSSDIAGLPSFRFLETSLAGVSGMLSRTGYTGEDGFEFYFDSKHSVTLWNAVLEHGSHYGLLPVGLGARNTLRLEARLMLYGNDIDVTTNPYEAGIGWVVSLDKDSFVGRAALTRARAMPQARKLVGFEMDGRPIARDGYPAFVDGVEVGRVTSGAPSLTLNRNIGLAYLPLPHTHTGTRFQVGIRGRLADARIVPTPFYKRGESHES